MYDSVKGENLNGSFELLWLNKCSKGIIDYACEVRQVLFLVPREWAYHDYIIVQNIDIHHVVEQD